MDVWVLCVCVVVVFTVTCCPTHMCVTVTWHGWASGWRKPGWWAETPDARSLPSWRKFPYRTWLRLTSPVMVPSYTVSPYASIFMRLLMDLFMSFCFNVYTYINMPFHFQNPNHMAALNELGLCELSSQLLWVLYSLLSMTCIFPPSHASLIRTAHASGQSSEPWITPHSIFEGSFTLRMASMLSRMGINHMHPHPSTERASAVQIRPQDPFIIRPRPGK